MDLVKIELCSYFRKLLIFIAAVKKHVLLSCDSSRQALPHAVPGWWGLGWAMVFCFYACYCLSTQPFSLWWWNLISVDVLDSPRSTLQRNVILLTRFWIRIYFSIVQNFTKSSRLQAVVKGWMKLYRMKTVLRIWT